MNYYQAMIRVAWDLLNPSKKRRATETEHSLLGPYVQQALDEAEERGKNPGNLASKALRKFKKKINNRKFEEKTAEQIIEKFCLDPHTLHVWKSRGQIPDKYFDSEYTIENTIWAEPHQLQKFLELVALPQLRNTELQSVSATHIADIQFSGGRLSVADWKKFSAEMAELKQKITTFTSMPITTKQNELRERYMPALRELLKDARLVKAQVVSEYLNDVLRKPHLSPPPLEHFQNARAKLVALAAKINRDAENGE